MKIVGLTGSIGVGKSMASDIFKNELNVPIIDADMLSFNAVKKGSKALEEIKLIFGDEVIDADGNLDRKKMGAIVFDDEEKREQLNNIIHPRVLEEFDKEVDFYREQEREVVIFDCPLLLEERVEGLVDIVLVIIADFEIQLDRIVKRDKVTPFEAKKRINSQMSQEEKIKRADYVIENNSTYEDLKKKIMIFYEKVLA